jgi:hypothetical protein
MLDPDAIQSEIRSIIIDVCEILYKKGFKKVSIGAMMRLVGVSEEVASQHDHEIYHLDEKFAALLYMKSEYSAEVPPGTMFH